MLQKKSFSLSGHRTSVALEAEFWVVLEEAQRVTVVLHYPWLLISALPVVLVVIAFNFVGDALRDAADPYAG